MACGENPKERSSYFFSARRCEAPCDAVWATVRRPLRQANFQQWARLPSGRRTRRRKRCAATRASVRALGDQGAPASAESFDPEGGPPEGGRVAGFQGRWPRRRARRRPRDEEARWGGLDAGRGVCDGEVLVQVHCLPDCGQPMNVAARSSRSPPTEKGSSKTTPLTSTTATRGLLLESATCSVDHGIRPSTLGSDLVGIQDGGLRNGNHGESARCFPRGGWAGDESIRTRRSTIQRLNQRGSGHKAMAAKKSGAARGIGGLEDAARLRWITGQPGLGAGHRRGDRHARGRAKRARRGHLGCGSPCSQDTIYKPAAGDGAHRGEVALRTATGNGTAADPTSSSRTRRGERPMKRSLHAADGRLAGSAKRARRTSPIVGAQGSYLEPGKVVDPNDDDRRCVSGDGIEPPRRRAPRGPVPRKSAQTRSDAAGCKILSWTGRARRPTPSATSGLVEK
jgi:hypothetical protein